MVVPVLITSCQLSENLNIGPVIAQAMMVMTATKNAVGEPTEMAADEEKRRNHSRTPCPDDFPFSCIGVA